MLALSASIGASAYDFTATSNGKTIYYNITGTNICEVTKNTAGSYSGDVVIPSTVKNGSTQYTVTGIGNYAFSGCSGLTSITIPNSVTSIGEFAFENCRVLTSLTIPNSVTSIGIYAFENCKALTSIVIPNSVTSIGIYTFYGCECLTSVTIPNSVTSIGDRSFQYCTGLTKITIPNSITSLGEFPFADCTGLTSITSEITNVFATGNVAFVGCPINATLYVPKGTKSTYQNTADWNRFTNIEELNYDFSAKNSDGVTIYYNIIDETAKTCEVTSAVNKRFYGPMDTDDTYTGDILIPSSANGYRVRGISLAAFMCCKNLTSVYIPISVYSIGSNAFQYCSSLESVTIPDSVTSIGIYTFQDCTSLTSVTIPNSVTSIGNFAFYGCEELKSLTIGNSVASIGKSAFSYCENLTSVTIPKSVTSIGEYAFRYCIGLTSVKSEITNVFETGSNAFKDCANATLYVPRGTKSLYQSTADWNSISNIVEIYNPYDVNDDDEVDISDVVELVNIILNDGPSYRQCPDNHHPHMIDLGLPSGTKWACCNVGASSPMDFGGYYAWGETEEKSVYRMNNYIHYDSTTKTYRNLGESICDNSEFDVAKKQWGSYWQMPSLVQIQELINNCTYQWTQVNGVYGVQFSGTNGGSIFLPAAGYLYESMQLIKDAGIYWSGTLTSDSSEASYLLFFSSVRTLTDKNFRYTGNPVRAVTSHLKGDVNEDKGVDISDVVGLVNYILGQ